MAELPDNAGDASVDRFEEARRALQRRWILIALTGKRPVHTGWTKRKLPTEKQVISWLKAGRNLGVLTGKPSGIIVVDDDSENATASASLDLPLTVTAITGSGRTHFYFKAPAGISIGNSVKTVAPGIDIRGDGGQVVLVGSIHPDTGQPYRWAPGLAPGEVEFADLPQHILSALKRGPNKSQFKIVRGNSRPQVDGRLEAYSQAALDAEIEHVRASTEGTRNDTVNRAAFALGQLVGAAALDQNVVFNALLQSAIATGLPEREARATIQSGITAGAQEPRNLQDLLTQHISDEEREDEELDDDQRPVIRLFKGWLHSATSRAERILLRHNPPVYYQRGTSLVRIVLMPEAGIGRSLRYKPLILDVTPAALVDKLTSLISWQRVDRKTGETHPTDCPERIALTLLSRSGSWKVPPLVGVVDAPTLRNDGGIIDTKGYDKGSGLYLALGDEPWPQVPRMPTRDDALAALDKLLWVLKDFPFVAEEDRSVALAAILTATIRPSLRTAPLFAFRAAKMGSGKSLLADVVSLIASGRAAAVMSQGADENEDKKRMLPILAEGEPVAVVDNIERPFGSAALCSILTQATWRDRVLGKSQTLMLSTANTTWLATGNNILFVGDITTRTLVCDLDPRCERPEEREFEINLHKHIPEHRPELVIAALTTLRAYHVAGRPDVELKTFGRFEEWSDWVRSTLVWLGQADPCLTRSRLEETDPVRAELSTLLRGLDAHFGAKPFRVADLLDAMQGDLVLREAVSSVVARVGQGQNPAQAIGVYFHQVQRRTEGGMRLVRCAATPKGSGTWAVEHV